MSSRHKRKNRLEPTQRFFQMHEWFFRTEAWKAATVYERALYLELKRRYNGFNNGDIPLSRREAEDALNCSNKPIAAAFEGLISKGFIRIAQAGSFDWKIAGGAGGRATRWILTEYPVDVPVKSLVPEKDFMKWKPDDAKNSRYAESTPMGVSGHTIKSSIVCPEHTINPKVYAGGTR